MSWFIERIVRRAFRNLVKKHGFKEIGPGRGPHAEFFNYEVDSIRFTLVWDGQDWSVDVANSKAPESGAELAGVLRVILGQRVGYTQPQEAANLIEKHLPELKSRVGRDDYPALVSQAEGIMVEQSFRMVQEAKPEFRRVRSQSEMFQPTWQSFASSITCYPACP
jgi:hypothetical protein